MTGEVDFPEENVTCIDGWKVVRSDDDCPHCGSDVRFHPDAIYPRWLIECFNCRAMLGRRWEQTRVHEFAD